MLSSLIHHNLFSSLMPQSHCPKSVPELARINHSSWFEWSFLVIRGHSSNDNDNDNPFKQCSSSACSQYEVFEHVQKVHVASANKFHSRWYAWRMCTQLLCLSHNLRAVFQSICTVHYVIRASTFHTNEVRMWLDREEEDRVVFLLLFILYV